MHLTVFINPPPAIHLLLSLPFALVLMSLLIYLFTVAADSCLDYDVAAQIKASWDCIPAIEATLKSLPRYLIGIFWNFSSRFLSALEFPECVRMN